LGPVNSSDTGMKPGSGKVWFGKRRAGAWPIDQPTWSSGRLTDDTSRRMVLADEGARPRIAQHFTDKTVTRMPPKDSISMPKRQEP